MLIQTRPLDAQRKLELSLQKAYLGALLVVVRRKGLQHPADLLRLSRQPERLKVGAERSVQGHVCEVELLGEALEDADVERVRLAKVLAQQVLQGEVWVDFRLCLASEAR
jgi:hypothetical protein